MGENRIYGALGFKSYDITRLIARAEVLFEWVERSGNLMRRTMYIQPGNHGWLVFVLQGGIKRL